MSARSAAQRSRSRDEGGRCDAAFFVDSWDPAYGASFEASAAGPAAPSSAQVDADVELPAVDWRAIGVRPGVRAPDVVLLVDGVRRIDASIWTAETDGGVVPRAGRLVRGRGGPV